MEGATGARLCRTNVMCEYAKFHGSIGARRASVSHKKHASKVPLRDHMEDREYVK